MTDADLFKLAHGKNYEEVMKLREESVQRLKENFQKKHPYADLSRFEFLVYIDDEIRVTQAFINFKICKGNYIDINTSTFLNNKEYTKYLTSKNMENTKKEFFRK